MRYLFLLICSSLLFSCSTSKESSQPILWTFEKAKTEFEAIKSQAPEVFEYARFINTTEKCEADFSSLAFPERGVESIFRKIKYPPELRTNGVQGIVRAEYTVYENGKSGEVNILFSPSLQLSRVVRDAILRTKHVPAYCNTNPAVSIAYTEISFNLGF